MCWHSSVIVTTWGDGGVCPFTVFHHCLSSFIFADLEPGLQQHIWFLQELSGSPSHQGHVQAAGLSGHRCGNGGAAEGCQKPGE